MNQDLRDHVQVLLRREPTRSLPLGVLRERLQLVGGRMLPGPLELEQALGREPGFRVLNALPLLDSVPGGYGPALAAAGLPQAEPRVVLVEESSAEDPVDPLLSRTREALLALLGRGAAQPAVADALGVLAEVADFLGPPGSLSPDGAVPSTTPPPGPRRPARGRRRGPP